MEIGAFYPQYRQFFFARAFGARGVASLALIVAHVFLRTLSVF